MAGVRPGHRLEARSHELHRQAASRLEQERLGQQDGRQAQHNRFMQRASSQGEPGRDSVKLSMRGIQQENDYNLDNTRVRKEREWGSAGLGETGHGSFYTLTADTTGMAKHGQASGRRLWQGTEATFYTDSSSTSSRGRAQLSDRAQQHSSQPALGAHDASEPEWRKWLEPGAAIGVETSASQQTVSSWQNQGNENLHRASRLRSSEETERPGRLGNSRLSEVSGVATEQAASGGHGLVQYVSESNLRDRISDRDLDFLELKAQLIRERNEHNAEANRREKELLARETSLRELSLKLSSERSELESARKTHEAERKKLSRKVQHAVEEIHKLNEEVHRNATKSSRSEVAFKRELAKKDSLVLALERSSEVLQSQLEAANDKLREAQRAETMRLRSNQEVAEEMATLRSRVRTLESHLSGARRREEELEDQLESLRAERDRAEESASRFKLGLERANAALDREKLHFEALQDEYQKLEQTKRSVQALPAILPTGAAGGASQATDGKASAGRESLSMKEKQQLVEMKAELRSCISQLKDWRQRVEDVEEKNRRLKAQLAAGSRATAVSDANVTGERVGLEATTTEVNPQAAKDASHGEQVSKLELRVEELELEASQAEARREKAEWERVEAEKSLGETQQELATLTEVLGAERDRMHELHAKVANTGAQLEAAEQDNQHLSEQLAAAQVEIDDARASAERAKKDKRVAHLARCLATYLDAVTHLVGLLEAYLDGQQPTMDMLLDEVSTSSSAKMEDPPTVEQVEQLVARGERGRAKVAELRSRVADQFAMSLSNDCHVQ